MNPATAQDRLDKIIELVEELDASTPNELSPYLAALIKIELAIEDILMNLDDPL